MDQEKDQSYFLWKLSPEQLEFSLFPVGNTTKSKIREEAAKAQIPTAAKKDSQGICFLGHVDIGEFLSHYVDLQKGDVLNESGKVIGVHNGALIYTTGQRHGFTITTNSSTREPHFVISRNIDKNTITVATTIPTLAKNELIKLDDIVLRTKLTNQKYDFQFRYRQSPKKASLKLNGNCLEVAPAESIEPPAPGQSVVLYDNTLCIGGGVVN